jgi:hypothetical protein
MIKTLVTLQVFFRIIIRNQLKHTIMASQKLIELCAKDSKILKDKLLENVVLCLVRPLLV